MASDRPSVTFETTVAASGNNTGIEVPEEVIGQLAAGKRPAVLVDVNGYQYRNTVGVMGGKHMISADVGNRHCVRVREGGEVLATVGLDRGAFACALSRECRAAHQLPYHAIAGITMAGRFARDRRCCSAPAG